MEEELEKLGLSEYESKVYLAGLSLGPVSANGIAEYTNIKRPTVYLALENLMKQGLMAESYVKKKRLFQAEKPEKLEKLTKRMRRKVIDAELILESILPELLKLPKGFADEPKVTFYSGLEGLRNIFLEVSASKSSWYVFSSTTNVLKKVEKEMKDLIGEALQFRRDPKRPKIYFITDNGILGLGGAWAKTKTPWREMKILPYTIESSSGVIIYEDKMAIFSFEPKPFGAVIKNKQAVEVVKLMYQMIWKTLV